MGHLGAGELILLFIVLLPAVLWIIALVDILRSEFHENNKLIWILVVVFVPIIGSVLYLAIGRSRKITA